MNGTPDLLTSSLKMLSALGLVLGGMLMVFYFIKRYLKRDLPGSKEKTIRVLASSYIGVKKNISLIEVPGSVLVVGITNENISLLTKIEDKEILNKLKLPDEERNHASFSEHLKKLTSRLTAHDK